VLTLSEISRRAGLSLSTAHRLVGELRAWGALERSVGGQYAIGLRILELGALEPQGLHLREAALPYFGDLQTATNGNVHLAVLDGRDMVYVETSRVRGGAAVLSRLGGRWPLHATATGQVLLSFAPRQIQEEVLASTLHRYTSMTITNPDQLRCVLAHVCRTGVAIAQDSITPDATAIAVPIRGVRDRVIAALGVTVRTTAETSMSTAQAVLPALSMTAKAISHALGAPSPIRQGSSAVS
jgi:DNA-binding IclR family transcriptional regulator